MSQKPYTDKHEEPMFCNRTGCMNAPEQKLQVIFVDHKTKKKSKEDVS